MKPMITRRWIATCAAALLVGAGTVGCNSNAYDPKMTNAELSAYATKNAYPADLPTTEAQNVVSSVADNGVITLSNTGDGTLADFQLWVNKSYVLKVASLPAHDAKTFAPELFFNAGGQSLKNEKPSDAWLIQIRQNGQLMTTKVLPRM